MFKKSFPFIKQLDSQDCGFACLKMVGKFYNPNFTITDEYISSTNLLKQGIAISDLNEAAKEVGFETLMVKLDFEKAVDNVPLPSVFFWNQNHFIVVHKIEKQKIYVADPAIGKTSYNKVEFLKGWSQLQNEGIILILKPKVELLEAQFSKSEKINMQFISKYLKRYNIQLIFIALTLLLSSLVEIIFPFFTQKIIDKGVFLKNINFIYTVLFAQIFLFISRIGLEYYRSWLFIHISSRISFSIISDFLLKLLKLPIRFFNSKTIGDLIQRIQDHKRVEEFLSRELIQIVFSFFSIIIYSSILLYFSVKIFLVVLISTSLELLWIFLFMKKVKINDYKNFSLMAKEQNMIFEMVQSIQEVKLNNLEYKKTIQWQEIQKKVFHNNIERLKINQKYESHRFLGFLQVILVVFFASIAVMQNSMTIGSMMSIMFILGALSEPVSQFINFVLKFQLVKVSLERLNEIHNKKEEENLSLIKELTVIENIHVHDVSFSYNKKNWVLKNIDILIPKNKTTAIVGVSGSGKTTLLKLLLKFFPIEKGEILIGKEKLENIDNSLWRKSCGVILQDSIIFSDTIEYNVALEENINQELLATSFHLANIHDFIEQLPLKEKTIIGPEGIGISQGQRQRLLIARAIYKNPDYLFFDEATNSLDAENEKIIVENINDYFKSKTMIIVAHRLSTVKNADQILVIDNGEVIEKGKHENLINLKGKYYSLIKNQLELGT